MAKFRFVEWLLNWLFETRNFEFEWDHGNRSKSKFKHDVETIEVEEVFKLRLAIPLGIQIEPEVDEERLGIVGPTRDGRLLHIVFTLKEGRVRPISGRPPAHKNERMKYVKT